MNEFFKGWRRKVGLITLVLTCLFMTAWMRSFDTRDSLFFGESINLFLIRDESYEIISKDGFIRWEVFVWVPHTPVRELFVIPYWSIVLPLTLLSAFLLLSKPCKTIHKKITEPTANEGA